MDIILILLILVGLVNFGCFIYVLVKLFSQEGAIKGIFGIICSLYTFFWGWQNADTLHIHNVMVVWSICIVIGMFANILLS